MLEIFGDERRHGFTQVPGKAEVEARVWYARNPRRCEDCSPRARGQGQEDVRTGILNENAFENVPLDVQIDRSITGMNETGDKVEKP